MARLLKWRVPERQKLAGFLAQNWGGSGKAVRRLLEKNCCRVNGKVERFASVWVEKGDQIEFLETTPTSSEIQTLFENDRLLIANKPANWVCDDSTCKKSFGPGIFLVHRLDKDTTGCLLLAKSAEVRDELMALFAGREVEKEYWALVDGIPRQAGGTIQSLLAKKGQFHGQTIWGSDARGDFALTKWQLLAKGEKASLIRALPETGRTHQIRVHMSEMGHPILVDRQYASRFRSPLFATRPLLHAKRLKFYDQGSLVDAAAPLPLDMRNALLAVGMEMGQLR